MSKVILLNGSPHVHGCTAAALDEMIKVFEAEDVKKDAEGLQTMRNLARNMTFLIRAIADAGEKYGYPEVESGCFTSFPDGK